MNMSKTYMRFIWSILPLISFGLCLNYIYFNIKGVYYLTGPSLFWVNNGPYFLTLFFFVFILSFFLRSILIKRVEKNEDELEPSFFVRVSLIIFKFLFNILSVQLSYITFRLLKLEKDCLDSINLFGDRVSFLSDYAIHRKWSFLELQEALMFKLNQLNLSMPSEQKDFFIFQSQGSMKNLNILIEEWVQKLSTPLPPLSFRQKLVNNLTSYFSGGLDFMCDNPKTTIAIVLVSSIACYFSFSYLISYMGSNSFSSRLDILEKSSDLVQLESLSSRLDILEKSSDLTRSSLLKLITGTQEAMQFNNEVFTKRIQNLADTIAAISNPADSNAAVQNLAQRLEELSGVIEGNAVLMELVLDFLSEFDPTFKESLRALLPEYSEFSVNSNQINFNNNND